MSSYSFIYMFTHFKDKFIAFRISKTGMNCEVVASWSSCSVAPSHVFGVEFFLTTFYLLMYFYLIKDHASNVH